MVPDTLSLHQLKAKAPTGESIADHFFAKFVKVSVRLASSVACLHHIPQHTFQADMHQAHLRAMAGDESEGLLLVCGCRGSSWQVTSLAGRAMLHTCIHPQDGKVPNLDSAGM